MDESLRELADYLTAELGGDLIDFKVAARELTIRVPADRIVRVLTFLRDNSNCKFRQLIDLCGADYPERAQRFDVVYHLLSPHLNQRIRVKIETDEATPVPTSTGVYSVAGWFEREAWDMYGIMFADHPDLRRILTDYGFQGFPLRKDFPLTGYVEVRYSEEVKRVVYEPVKLAQDFRSFDFMSPWEGAKYVLPPLASGDDQTEAK